MTRHVMLSFRDPTDDPDALAWLQAVEDSMNAEIEMRIDNLIMYGISHPELLFPAFGATVH